MDFPKNDDLIYNFDIDLKKYTTIRVSTKGNVIEVKSINALKLITDFLSKNKFQFEIIGIGANQLLIGGNKFYLKLKFNDPVFDNETPQDEYTVPSSMTLNKLTKLALIFGYKGWESFTGIPASVGGAIAMNAGTKLGEFGDIVREVQIFRNSQLVTHRITDGDFKYRGNTFLRDKDIIVSAKLIHKGIDESVKDVISDYIEYRKKTQPLSTKNCGCVFKNHPMALAGKSIDLLCLKGIGFNGLRISQKHANFFENFDEATIEDFETLKDIVLDDLDRYLGYEFELEPKLV